MTARARTITRWLDVLRDGDTDPWSGDRSRAALSLATGLAAHGWTEQDFTDALTDPANAAARWYRHDASGRTRKDWRSRMARDWGKATARVRERPHITTPGEARHEIASQVLARESTPWKGRSAGPRLALLEHLHTVATRAGSMEIRQSLAQLTEGARLSRPTVRRHLPWLIGRGWVRVVAAPDATRGTTYRLSASVPSSHLTQGVGLLGTLADSDALEVLTTSERRVLRLLRPGRPVTTAEVLAHPTTPARSATYRALASLAARGIAELIDGLWHLVTAAVAALAPLGAPRAAARRALNAARRSLWDTWRSARAAAVAAVRARRRPVPA